MNFDPFNSPTAAAIWHDAAKYGIDLAGAIIILVGGWWLAGWATRALHRNLSKHPWMDATLLPLVVSVVRYGILIGAMLAVLDQFGIQLTSLVAVLGAAGLAIGLALQGTLSNVAAGVMLVGLRPFHVGNQIEAAGFSGTVEEVGLFATVIRTSENRIVTVPNKMLSDAPITNNSRHAVHRTQTITFQLPYNADLDRALSILKTIAAEHSEIEGTPVIGVEELGDSWLKLKIQVTAPDDLADATRMSINLAIRREFSAAGIRFAPEAAG